MQLYYFPRSTYSQKVLLAIHEKNIPCQTIIVKFNDPEARKNYRTIYPMGKVPYLVLDNGDPIPESSFIIEYLDSNFEQAPQLIPQDKAESRQVRFHERMMDLYLNDPIVQLRVPPFSSIEFITQRAKFYLDNTYKILNDSLQKVSYIAGNDFTVADCAAIPALYYAQETYAFSDYPHLENYFNRMLERPSVQNMIDTIKGYT